jgi:RNA polymerase sigma factor (sigma-70 family)
MSISDSTLLTQWIERRDPDAFNKLTSRYMGMVYATSTRILGNVTEAEDVTQDCFERLATMTKGPKGHLGAWLHRVATNRAIDCIRKEKRRLAREENYVAESEVCVDTDWDDIYPYVDEAIANLPEKLREPLVAHYLEGQTHTAISNDLGLSRQAVTRRIARGVNGVRKALRRRGITVTVPPLAALMGAHLAEAVPVPASLQATLGKLAVAGLKRSVAGAAGGASVTTIGGLIVMKQTVIGVGIVAVLALGSWILISDNPLRSSSESAVAQSPGTATRTVVEDTQLDSDNLNGGAASRGQELPTGLATDQAKLEGAVIAGRVYDVDTQVGIPEAVVDARRMDGGDDGWAETDASGRFRITGLTEGKYDIGPSILPGYPEFGVRRKWVKISLIQDQVMEDVNFAFEQGIGVVGIVVSADGQPTAGARVGAMVSGMPGAEHATSGPDGAFVVRLAEPGADLIVKAKSDEFESELVGPVVLPPEGIDGLVLTLTNPRSASISGMAFNAAGLPTADAGIHLDRGSIDYLVGSGHAETSSDGSFLIEYLAPGEYGVLLIPRGRNTFSDNDEIARVNLDAGQALSGLRLVLGGDKGGYAIAGRVVDTKGNPVNQVVVSADGPTHEEGRTQDDGEFEITGLLDGVYSLHATHMGENSNSLKYSPGKAFDVLAGTLDVEIVMQGQGVVEGRVVQADTGEPLQDFELYLCNGGANEFSSRLLLNGERVRHPEGRFSREIYVGWVTVTARAEGFAPAFQSVDVREHETTGDIELRLKGASNLTGLVVNSDGDPVAGARVYFGGIPHTSEREKVAAETNSEGVFTIDAASPDIRELSATHPEYAPATSSIGERTTIVLEEAGAVEGVVTQLNQPLPDATVGVRYLDRQNMPWTGSNSEPSGAYRIGQLPPGEVEVTAEIAGDRRVTAQAIVAPGTTTDVDLDFAPATSVVHGLIDAAAFNPQHINVECAVITESGVESRRGSSQPDGTYRIEGIPAGHAPLSAQIWSPDSIDVKQFAEFDLADDETVRHDFVFSSNPTLSGRFLGYNSGVDGGVFVLDGEVQLPQSIDLEFFTNLHYTNLIVTQAQCDADGAFAVAGLAPGTYTVLALTVPGEDAENVDRVRTATSVVKVERDEPVTVDFDLR